MSGFKIVRLKPLAPADHEKAWATFDVEFDDGATAHNVSMIDDGTFIRLSGIEVSLDLREKIIHLAMAEYIRQQR